MKSKEFNEEIRSMDNEEIRDKLKQLRKEELIMSVSKQKGELRVKSQSGPTNEYGKYKRIKKDIARCLTELNMRCIKHGL